MLVKNVGKIKNPAFALHLAGAMGHVRYVRRISIVMTTSAISVNLKTMSDIRLKNMTLEQLAANHITTVRKPNWNDKAYLRIQVTSDGKLGMVGTLVDPYVDLEERPVLTTDKSNDWEQF